jgi:hypothetical protein
MWSSTILGWLRVKRTVTRRKLMGEGRQQNEKVTMGSKLGMKGMSGWLQD